MSPTYSVLALEAIAEVLDTSCIEVHIFTDLSKKTSDTSPWAIQSVVGVLK